MSWQIDVAEHLRSGMSVEDIHAAIQADPRHKRKIMATAVDPDEQDLGDLLVSEYGVLTSNTLGAWEGSLADYMDGLDPAVPAQQELHQGLGTLLYNLTLTNRPVRCGTVARIGKLVTALTTIVGNLIGDSARVQADMDRLTGGLRGAGVTMEMVRDEVAAIGVRQARELLEAKWVAIQGDGGVDAAVAAGDPAALADALEAAVVSLRDGGE